MYKKGTPSAQKHINDAKISQKLHIQSNYSAQSDSSGQGLLKSVKIIEVQHLLSMQDKYKPNQSCRILRLFDPGSEINSDPPGHRILDRNFKALMRMQLYSDKWKGRHCLKYLSMALSAFVTSSVHSHVALIGMGLLFVPQLYLVISAGNKKVITLRCTLG